eukprot:1342757-Pleurochrysis_carterae.AAC.11
MLGSVVLLYQLNSAAPPDNLRGGARPTKDYEVIRRIPLFCECDVLSHSSLGEWRQDGPTYAA